jgi:CHASE3 domain sensor protein
VATFVIILVLLVVAVGAVAAMLLMIRSNRRQLDDSPRPAMGSPAQVWLSRAERVVRELGSALAGHEAWQGVTVDAEQVVEELRSTASQVAEVDHALSQIEDPRLEPSTRLRASRDTLLTRMENAVAGLEQARAEVVELIATASSVIVDPDPTRELNSRLAGLRAGLIEVRGVVNPETGSGNDHSGQGHP